MLTLHRLDAKMRRDQKTLALRMGLLSMGVDPDEIIKTHRGDSLGISLAFARELEYIDKNFLEWEYPDLKARDLIPLYGGVPSWAQTYSYREMNQVGEAKIVHDYANDFPRVDLDVGETTPAPIVGLGCSYGYSVMDLRYAAELGQPLESDLLNTAKEAEERKLDALACYGHAPSGLRGFANNSSVLSLSTALNGAMAKHWGAANALAITADIDLIVDNVSNASDNKYRVDTIGLSTTTYNLLQSKKFQSLDNFGNPFSVLDYFENRKKNPITFEPWFRLASAGAGNVERLVAYQKSLDVVRLVVPQDFEQAPPERKNFSFQVACHLRFGGVEIRRPMAMRYIDDPVS